MEFQALLFLYIIIILSSIIHEYSHGWMANALGDPTAKYAGRLTLNPLAHIDLWGTVILPLFLMSTTGIFFGYAKPVPFNPYNLKNQKSGIALIGAAGPFSNFLVAIILGLLVRFSVIPILQIPLSLIVLINIWLMLFNLLPFAPADGSKILAGLLPYPWQQTLEAMNPLLGIVLAIMVAFYLFPVIIPLIVKLIIGQNLIF